ncbi:MAG TPA: ABC transporter ATP-binding protein [Tepidisphaeraceae bacterium]|jgi:iron complex transport system ATP-binding protein|nr:ABC transporter ATP-binding protein [Tepidisphaeraceae bacterium]
MNRILSADNLTFAYGDRPALRSISIDLAPGEIVTLLGPNGSGKSTLIKVLLGHLQGEGEIAWEDRPMRAWSRRELARRVAYLPQSPLFDAEQTVREVLLLGRAPYWIAFGLESQRDLEVVHDIAQSLALVDLMSRRMDELSGGQRQRVFLARCLIQEPAALLLDEPSTFLDLKHQVELTQLLRKLSREKNIAVLMASHDLNLAAAGADRLVLLNNGELVANGPPNDVLNPDLLSRVYGVPMERIPRDSNQTQIVVPIL